ncbi:MAG: hypothetical protein ABEJ57_06450, partial [Halobacteriaceae archaeon]
MTGRAQSSVVGVALLLAVTVTSMAVLTVGVGSVIDGAATGAQLEYVADRFQTLFPGATARDAASGPVRLTGGVLDTVDREVRIYANTTPV